MRFSFLCVLVLLTLVLSLTDAFADQGYKNLLLDGSFVRFNYDGTVPEVLIRIPYFDKVMRIQGGDELRFPMSYYYDVKVPLRYQFTNQFSMQMTASIERIYSMQSPYADASGGAGVPLNSLFGFGASNHTQQFLGIFSLNFSF
jgi:hypothetical protein